MSRIDILFGSLFYKNEPHEVKYITDLTNTKAGTWGLNLNF